MSDSENGQLVTSADGTRIWVSVAGDSANVPVVFIHGLSMNTLAWNFQFRDPEFLQSFYMIRFDVRGHGRSDMPDDPVAYHSRRFAEDFKAVCDAYGVENPFVVAW